MRMIHLFHVTYGTVKCGDSACGQIVNVDWSEVTDCAADHKAANVCKRCIKKQVAGVHTFPALVGAP